MAVGPLDLYWKRQLVGVITDPTWSDFPWIIGRFEARRMSKRIRQVLEWFAAEAKADAFREPPFETERIENWVIVKPDRSRVELLMPPLIDFEKGLAEWRE